MRRRGEERGSEWATRSGVSFLRVTASLIPSSLTHKKSGGNNLPPDPRLFLV